MIDKLKKRISKYFSGNQTVKKHKKYEIKKYFNKKKYNEKLTPRTLINVITEFKFFQKTLLKYKEFDIRLPIIPEFVTENLCMLCIKNILGDKSVTRKCVGDLVSEEFGLIEVKAFSSNAPNSFSTKMKWNSLFFCDCRSFEKNVITIYKVNMELCAFKRLKVTNDKTFKDCEDIKQRAKVSFENLKVQESFKYDKIFEGDYKKLLVTT